MTFLPGSKRRKEHTADILFFEKYKNPASSNKAPHGVIVSCNASVEKHNGTNKLKKQYKTMVSKLHFAGKTAHHWEIEN